MIATNCIAFSQTVFVDSVSGHNVAIIWSIMQPTLKVNEQFLLCGVFQTHSWREIHPSGAEEGIEEKVAFTGTF